MFDTGIVLLEVFLFDFSGDLYGRTLDVAVIGWIRPEMTFDTVADLIRRMDEDCSLAHMALKRAGDAFPPLGRFASPFARSACARPPGLSAAGSM